MARICYAADEEVAHKGLLRISVIAKLLKVAPKTVNAWTQYTVIKIRGVKYLSWGEIGGDPVRQTQLLGLPVASINAYNLALQKIPLVPTIKPVTAADTALAKAKALLKKPELPKMEYVTHTGSGVNVGEYRPLEPESDEVLTPHFEIDDMLTVKSDYGQLAKK
jgi:hypothetical protein